MNRILIAESGSGYGGSAKYLAGLLPLIDRSKFDIELVAYGRGPLIQQIEKEGQVIYHKSMWRFPWAEGETQKSEAGSHGAKSRPQTSGLSRQTSAVIQMLEYIGYVAVASAQLLLLVPTITFWLRKHKIEMIHLNNEILSHLPLVLAARLSGCRILCHLHGWRKLTGTERLVNRLIDQFIAVTQSGADFYNWQLRSCHVEGIPNGLLMNETIEKTSSPEKRKEMRIKLNLEDHDVLAVLIGRFIPLKGHSVMLDALAKAKKTCPQLHVVFVGNDPSRGNAYKEELKTQITNLGIAEHVQFLPWQDHMGPVYDAADIVMQPSIQPESFGYVALEGMAAGKPVIASRIGGLPDVVVHNETGFLVEPGNSDALAQALEQIVRDEPLAKRFGMNGNERARRLFNMQHNAGRIQEIYDRILDRPEILIAESGTGYGGSGKHLSELVPVLIEHDVPVTIVSYGDGPFIRKIEQSSISVTYKKWWRFPWFDGPWTGQTVGAPFIARVIKYVSFATIAAFQILTMVPIMTFWLKRRKIKFVHLNCEILSHIPLLIASKLAGCKTLCLWHVWRPITRFERILNRLVDEHAAVSNRGAKFYTNELKRNVTVIQNGIRLPKKESISEAVRRQMRAGLGFSGKTFAVAIFGRLLDWKGQDIFIHAIEKANEQNLNIVGLIVGRDQTADQIHVNRLKALVRMLGMEKKIQFLLWQEEVQPLYSMCDLIVHASRKPEPFGLVALEAMACKVPVIATRGGGIEDFVIDGETGCLVDPDRVDQLTSQILHLSSHPDERKKIAERAYQEVTAHFSIETNARLLQDIYRKIYRAERTGFFDVPTETSRFKHRAGRYTKEALFYSGVLNVVRNVRQNAVPIVMYHRVFEKEDPFFPAMSHRTFKEQIDYLKRTYRILPLDAVIDHWISGRGVPSKSLAITFDDGDAQTWSYVYPILKEEQIPATVFLALGSSEQGEFLWMDILRWYFKLTAVKNYAFQTNGHKKEWKLSSTMDRLEALHSIARALKTFPNDERKKAVRQIEADLGVKRHALPKEWLLTRTQIRTANRDLINFGAHTITHPILSKMPITEVRYEIYESKRLVEDLVGEKVRHFAYPNGEASDFTRDHEELVFRAGFDSACTSILGLNNEKTNRYALRRIYAKEEPLAVFAARLAGVGS